MHSRDAKFNSATRTPIAILFPSSKIPPLSGSKAPDKTFISVDLPAPFCRNRYNSPHMGRDRNIVQCDISIEALADMTNVERFFSKVCELALFLYVF